VIDELELLQRILPTRQAGARWMLASSVARAIVVELGVLAVLGALVFALQWTSGTYHSEVGGVPDEGAHFITGLMVRDYLVASDHRAPLRFAEDYYLHYPKVALGHWPPLLYVLSAPWMLLFAATPAAVHALIGVLAILLGFLLYASVAAHHGKQAGLLVAALMLSTPFVAENAGLIMADMLVAVTSFAATLMFARYLETERRRDALWSGLLALLALQSKPSAVSLLAVAVLGIVLCRRWHLLKQSPLWLAALVVFAGSAPWYLVTREMVTRGAFVQDAPSLGYAATALGWYVPVLFRLAGPLVGIAAVAGVAARVVQPLRQGVPVQPLEATMAGLLVGTVAVVCIVPTGYGPRLVLPAVPAVLIFATEGVVWAASTLPVLRRNVRMGAGMIAAVAVLAFLIGCYRVVPRADFGFAAINAQLLAPGALEKPVVLLVTDPTGENMMLSDLASREPRPGHFILRGSKVLADQTWEGTDYKLRYRTPGELIAYLDSVPVDYMITDGSPSEFSRPGHLDLLERTIRETPQRWREVGRFPRVRQGRTWPDALRVYEFVHAPSSRVQIRIDLQRMLNRKLEIRKGAG